MKESVGTDRIQQISSQVTLDYRWATGPYLGKLFTHLKEKGEIVTTRCKNCQHVIFPARAACPRCSSADIEWIHLGNSGVIEEIYNVEQPLMDPNTGQYRNSDKPIGTIRLDGGGVFDHYLDPQFKDKLKIGRRVTAVYKPKEERAGAIQDIMFFTPLKDSEGPSTLAGRPLNSTTPVGPQDSLPVHGKMVLPFNTRTGPAVERFLTELRDHQAIVGNRCKTCGEVYSPPASVCPPCFSRDFEWVQLSGNGVLESFCSTGTGLVDDQRTYALIRLDGASTSMLHFLNPASAKKPAIGMRVKPVFQEKRIGSILDIRYFEPAEM